jgi:hypothetical protein
MTSGPPMTENQKEMLISLCTRIEEEQDPEIFDELVVELNALLDRILGPNK